MDGLIVLAAICGVFYLWFKKTRKTDGFSETIEAIKNEYLKDGSGMRSTLDKSKIQFQKNFKKRIGERMPIVKLFLKMTIDVRLFFEGVYVLWKANLVHYQ